FQAIDGYQVEWNLVHAKNYGVPQNRPRVLLVGYRNDIWKNHTEPTLKLKEDPSPYNAGGDAITKGFLPKSIDAPPPSLINLLSDLEDSMYIPGGSTDKYTKSATTPIQKWLRTSPSGKLLAKGSKLTEQEYSNHSEKVTEKFRYMLASGGKIPDSMKTKKFAQRVMPIEWGINGPNITATSLPDDYVHYSQPRVPTVREWARIQTFPDWYQFAGPRTTGGRRRAGDPDAGLWDREVPKYTQIGNAVPVLLANKVALHIKKILS
ncbi:MAG: DNA cytosine methyltransferase, partial [Akkermansiaceae bacterium]